MNSEGITLEDTKHFKFIGVFNNHWRSRRVELFRHPIDENLIVSVGYPMPKAEQCGPIVCVEAYEYYAARIENNDWTDYH